MKVATVHFDAVFADINGNYMKAEAYIKEAKSNHVEILALPEFFTTGFMTSRQLIQCIARQEDSSLKMIDWSVKYQMYIGGSYLYYDGDKVLNVYCLACPDGRAFYHAKDVPTVLEGLYYEAGDENKTARTAAGDVGMCMCWEMMRYNTVRSMQGKVNFVMAGSCWWEVLDGDMPDSMVWMKKMSAKEALNAPVRLAELLHVPVIHASHKAVYAGENIKSPSQKVERRILGASQIIDGNGNILAKKEWWEEPGLIYADIEINQVSETKPLPERYWISLPDEFTSVWNQINYTCHSYYKEVTLPYCQQHVNK